MRTAIAVIIASAVALGAQLQDVTTITLHGQQCGPEGDAKSDAGKALDRDKNRFEAPDPGDLDTEVTLASLLAPGDDVDRFDQKKGARVAGYVVGVKVGGTETCNCHATKPDERDTHIELALSKGAPSTQRVIVEVTPRLRILKQQGQVDWTTQALQDAIKGQWVEVTGWLLFDTAHINEAENTNPGGRGNWRATCWEVHPITDLKVAAAPPAAAELAPTILAEMQRGHARGLRRTPLRMEEIAKRNRLYLSKFDASELDRDAPKE